MEKGRSRSPIGPNYPGTRRDLASRLPYTHKAFGPDDDLAQKDLCCDPSRSCFEAL